MTKKNIVEKNAVLQALGTVQEPELHQDLVTLDMIKNLKIDNNKVELTVMLTTPACPLKNVIESDIKKALETVGGVESVKVNFDSNIKQNKGIAEKLQFPVKNIIAIASGKGGVGKSTVSVNVALALAQSGAKVGLLDADIYGPNIPQMLGVDKLPAPQNNKLVPAVVHGIQVISMGFLVGPDQPIIWRGPMLHKAIQDLFMDVLWDELDYMIVDLPPGTGDVQLSLAQTVPLTGGVVVSTPQDIALADARRGLAAFQKLNVPILGIIENMAYFIAPDTGNRYEIFGHGGAERAAEELKVPFLGRLPLDPKAREGGDDGKPVILEHPETDISKSFIDLAGKIAARLSVVSFQGSEKFKMKNS
jgi:ATP-binding protein involved in chromosome partitioning